MNFADKLKARAAETGQKTQQGVTEDMKASANAKKAGDLKSLAATLKSAKKVAPVDERKAMIVDFPTGAIKAWSFSTLKKFENCQWAVKLNKVDKIYVESGEGAKRGTIIHDGCEDWVRSKTNELPADRRTKFDAFSDDFIELRQNYRDGILTMEEEWGIRKDWSPCEWDDAELWGRAKLDAFVRTSETSCRIIDYKTGRKFGNEMSHSDQGLSYALHTMHRYPEIDVFHVEFWYLDEGVKMQRSFNRLQLQILLTRYHNRAMKLTTVKKFTPSPNAHTCRFCEYGSNTNKDGKAYGNGECGFDFYRGLDDAV